MAMRCGPAAPAEAPVVRQAGQNVPQRIGLLVRIRASPASLREIRRRRPGHVRHDLIDQAHQVERRADGRHNLAEGGGLGDQRRCVQILVRRPVAGGLDRGTRRLAGQRVFRDADMDPVQVRDVLAPPTPVLCPGVAAVASFSLQADALEEHEHDLDQGVRLRPATGPVVLQNCLRRRRRRFWAIMPHGELLICVPLHLRLGGVDGLLGRHGKGVAAAAAAAAVAALSSLAYC